jgi:site-specific recombinase XerD
MTLPAHFTEWIDWLQDARKVSSHTVEAYEGDMRQFLNLLKS